MSECTIRAADYCRPDEGPVDSAKRLSEAILAAADAHSRVLVSMESVSGASSSFFNVVFVELAARLGGSAARSRIEFVAMGRIQSTVAKRSREAVLGPGH